MQQRDTSASREPQAQSSTLSARPTSTSFSGKCTAKVSTLVPDELKDEFRRWALQQGYPSESDCLREVLILLTRGSRYLANLHRDRIELLTRNLTGIAPDDDGGGAA